MKKPQESQTIFDAYVQLARSLGHHPSRAELLTAGISRDKVKYYFGNLAKLKALATEKEGLKLADKAAEPALKVLLFDIETAPILANVWGLWDQNVGLNQIEADWSVLSWSAKWLHEADVMYADNRKRRGSRIRDDKALLKGIWKLLDEADVVVTQNGVSFDSPKLNARFITHGFQPPSSYRHIDTLKIAKKHFAFTSNKLAHLTATLCSAKKSEHKKFPGFELWEQCLKGNQLAWREMEEYNKQDVLALEELFHKLKAWDDKINFAVYTGGTICKCGSTDIRKSGFHYTNSSKFQRYRCAACGAETRDRKNLAGKTRAGTR